MPPRLRDRGEHDWVTRLIRALPRGRRTLIGPGDDAAGVRAPPPPALPPTRAPSCGGDGRPPRTAPGADPPPVRPPRRPLLLTTDALVEGVHFHLGWESPSALGRRAL